MIFFFAMLTAGQCVGAVLSHKRCIYITPLPLLKAEKYHPGKEAETLQVPGVGEDLCKRVF